jgi:pyruvate-formate lyase-activating enzyme
MKVSLPLSSSAITYTLGRSLYVSITSRCNSRSLPETRGPNFLLPSEVVSTLCRFRDLEHETQQWHHWCNYLDCTEYPQKLPDPFEMVDRLKEEAELQPTVSVIQDAIKAQLEKQDYEAIVIAGEGEPTLRWEALLLLAQEFSSAHKFRVTTNGLVNPERVCEMKQHGVDAVTVALMTGNPKQYIELMEPLLREELTCLQPYELVCQFIQEAVRQELEVEVTAVDRKEVDRKKTEAMAASLGVTTQVRWRPYFS